MRDVRQVNVLGTVRTVSEVTRERVLEGVRRVADGVATAHGAEATVELIRGYPVTSNDAGFAEFVLDRGVRWMAVDAGSMDYPFNTFIRKARPD